MATTSTTSSRTPVTGHVVTPLGLTMPPYSFTPQQLMMAATASAQLQAKAVAGIQQNGLQKSVGSILSGLQSAGLPEPASDAKTPPAYATGNDQLSNLLHSSLSIPPNYTNGHSQHAALVATGLQTITPLTNSDHRMGPQNQRTHTRHQAPAHTLINGVGTANSVSQSNTLGALGDDVGGNNAAKSTSMFFLPENGKGQPMICSIPAQLLHGQKIHIITERGETFSTIVSSLPADPCPSTIAPLSLAPQFDAASLMLQPTAFSVAASNLNLSQALKTPPTFPTSFLSTDALPASNLSCLADTLHANSVASVLFPNDPSSHSTNPGVLALTTAAASAAIPHAKIEPERSSSKTDQVIEDVIIRSGEMSTALMNGDAAVVQPASVAKRAKPKSQGSMDNRISATSSNGHSIGIDKEKEQTVAESAGCSTVDGIDLEEIKEFAKKFKMKRLSLGLTQTQVGQALSVSEGPAYSQSAICRFEKLDITPKSAQKIKPVLEQWMSDVEKQYQHSHQLQIEELVESTANGVILASSTEGDGIECASESGSCSGEQSVGALLKERATAAAAAAATCSPTATSSTDITALSGVCAAVDNGTKKRKRRTSFTPQALELLNEYFDKNTHPTGAEMTSLAESLNYDREVVRVWFCNKRQALKNTIKKLKLVEHS